MVKIELEIIKDKWLLIETIPLTPKTNNDFKQRIPQNTLLWRPIYLNKIVKKPKITMEDWGNIAFHTITSICNCINQALWAYNNYSTSLDVIMEEIEKCPLEDYNRFNKLTQNRDKILQEMDDIENNKRIFKYSQQAIKKNNKYWAKINKA